MTKEQALQKLAEYFKDFDYKANAAFKCGGGYNYTVNAARRYSAAQQYKKLANLKTMDEAVAEIRKRIQ